MTLDDAGLQVLLRSLDEHAHLDDTGRVLTDRFLARLHEVRAQLDEYVRRYPSVRDVAIREPLFVTGAPRTGTTLLFALLAEDRRHRVPLGWELLHPVPPPIGADEATRIERAERELRGLAEATGGSLDAIHTYGARQPKECLSAMSLVFRSEEFTARYRVPAYVDWLQRCDMRPAYEVHRLVLQVLQREPVHRDRRWVLKSPVHLHSLPTLLAVYPDARVVVTHRDPSEVLGSVNSLVATLRSAHSGDVDLDEIARYHADLYGRSLDALVDVDAGGRMQHVRYADLAADPLDVVHKLYADLGMPLTADAEGRMRAYVGAQPRPKHAYEPIPANDERFARYREHFGV